MARAEPDLGNRRVAAVLAAAALCFLASGLLVRRSLQGVDKTLLAEHSRWLATDETVLILQAPIDRMQVPVVILRQSAEIPPVISVLNPKRPNPFDDEPSLGTPFSPAQMQDHARRLAGEHILGRSPGRSTALIDRLGQSRSWIRLVCEDLSEAALLEQRTTPIAEWILDNEYIIEGNVRDVQQNLSRRFYQVLPTLQSRSYRNLPRIYGCARELVTHAGLRIDRENIVAFVEAYQTIRALTIAELWAIPQMLRIALIEGIQALAARGLAELRDREIADFWANRLITANRRDPNHLFAIMAELAANQPDPSPYFAFQLVEHLYDEEAALAPVQSWLERINRKPLSELTAREQGRQTKDQISIGNAFTSLRQLALLDWRQIFEHVSRVDTALKRDPSGHVCPHGFPDARPVSTRNRGGRPPVRSRRGERGPGRDEPRRTGIAARARRLPFRPCRDIPHRRRQAGARQPRQLPRDGTIPFPAVVMPPPFRGVPARADSGSACFLFLIARLSPRAAGADTDRHVPAFASAGEPALPRDRELPGHPRLPPHPGENGFPGVGHPRRVSNPRRRAHAADGLRDGNAEVQKLEIRYLANREATCSSACSRITMIRTPSRPGDGPLLQEAIAGSRPSTTVWRQPIFPLSSGTPLERIRAEIYRLGTQSGKLEELNQLIAGARPRAWARSFQSETRPLADVRFVITLDSDTQLPHGTAAEWSKPWPTP